MSGPDPIAIADKAQAAFASGIQPGVLYLCLIIFGLSVVGVMGAAALWVRAVDGRRKDESDRRKIAETRVTALEAVVSLLQTGQVDLAMKLAPLVQQVLPVLKDATDILETLESRMGRTGKSKSLDAPPKVPP